MPPKKTSSKKAAARKPAAKKVVTPVARKAGASVDTRKLVAELLGTFILTFAVSLSIATGTAATPLVAALTLALFVYTIGGISGCHINPAVTLALLSIKKISGELAAKYIVVQIVGALIAMALLSMLSGGDMSYANALSAESLQPHVGIGELLGSFVFVFGIASVVHGKAKDSVAGVVIGGSLLLGIITAASGFSDGILNPAVAIGLKALSPMYLIGPIAGGILGALSYSWIANK